MVPVARMVKIEAYERTDHAPNHWDSQQPDVGAASFVGVNKNRLRLNYAPVDEIRKLLFLRQDKFNLLHKNSLT